MIKPDRSHTDIEKDLRLLLQVTRSSLDELKSKVEPIEVLSDRDRIIFYSGIRYALKDILLSNFNPKA